MTTEGMVFRTEDASKGAYQGILQVRGKQESITLKPGKSFDGKEPKDQATIVLTDVVVQKMAPGETAPELKDDKFTIWISYAAPGKRPSANSLYIKGFVASAEKLGKTPPEFNGEYVTFARLPVMLFNLASKTDPNAPKEIEYATWQYIEDSGDSVGIADYIKTLVIGNSPTVVTRNLLTDSRAKQHPEYRQALTEGTFENLLGVLLVDGKYQVKGG